MSKTQFATSPPREDEPSETDRDRETDRETDRQIHGLEIRGVAYVKGLQKRRGTIFC